MTTWSSTDPGADRGDIAGGPAENRLPDLARRALVTLLMNRYVSRARHRAAWDGIRVYRAELSARLDEMFLDLVVDEDAGVAFKRQQDGEDVPRVLRRERPLTRDASFVLIHLAQEYAQADPDDGPVVITRDQIGEFLRTFREEGDSDDARFSRRVDGAINTLIKPWQIIERDPNVDYLFTISPVIAPLIGPDEMVRLHAAFRRGTEAHLLSAADPDPGDVEHDAAAGDTDRDAHNGSRDTEGEQQ